MKVRWHSALVPVLAVTLLRGAAAQRLEFEVASIKPAPPQPPGVTNTRTSIDDGHLLFTNVTVKEVAIEAFRVFEYQIEGPGWIGSDRFDIAAKIPEGAPKDSARNMLQSLLADRFQFAYHRETRQMAAYVLTIAPGGSKLKQAESATGISTSSNGIVTRVQAQTSLRELADYLSRRVDRPVVDGTGLGGAFDFTLNWSADGADTGDLAGPPPLFTALRDQLGLKLESKKAPVEILVIDRVARPSEN